MKLLKKDLIERAWAATNGTNMSKRQVTAVVTATLDALRDAIAEEHSSVYLSKLGTFHVTERDEREARNPKTGEQITVPSHFAVRFKPATSLRTALKESTPS